MITETIIHQIIGAYIIKYLRAPRKIAINSEAFEQLDPKIKHTFSGLLVPDYFLPFNNIEAL